VNLKRVPLSIPCPPVNGAKQPAAKHVVEQSRSSSPQRYVPPPRKRK